jgi:hypothetical protein
VRVLRRTAALALLAVAGALLPSPAAVHACTCLPPVVSAPPDPGRVVFEGTVTGLYGLDLGRDPVQAEGVLRRAVWTFAVDRVLAGAVIDPPEVVTGLGSGDCGASFAIGSRYQVVASRLPPGAPADIAGRLVTSICAGNRPLPAEQTAPTTLPPAPVPPPAAAPAAEAPAASAPLQEAPAASAPLQEAPAASAPLQEAPAAEAPAEAPEEAPEAEAPPPPSGP